MEPSQHDLINVSLQLPRAILDDILDYAPTNGSEADRRLALAKWILNHRRRRETTIPAIRLGEPTWPMLLDLYAATQAGRRVDVSGLCLASGIPPTTAQRYVDMLVVKGYIAKSGDEKDHRRAFVTMSDQLRAEIDTWLERAVRDLVATGLL